MTYRVYSGPRGTAEVSPLEKENLLYKEFDLLDEALSWARHLGETARVALLIEGDDGTHLSKSDIAVALLQSRGRGARNEQPANRAHGA